MRKAAETAILLAALLVAATGVRAQSPAKDEKPSGSISGTVTINGKPARGIKVVAIQGNPVAIDFTDESGRYDLKALAAGLCKVTVDAAGFTMKDEDDDWSSFGKNVEIGSGEKVEGVDFDLIPGGVITGRVTDADGRPIIYWLLVHPAEGGETAARSQAVAWTAAGRAALHREAEADAAEIDLKPCQRIIDYSIRYQQHSR